MSSIVSRFCCWAAVGATSASATAAGNSRIFMTSSIEPPKEPPRSQRTQRVVLIFVIFVIFVVDSLRGSYTDVSRRRRHGHRIEAPARSGRSPHPRRLRIVPGSQGASRTQLGGASDRSAPHRRRRADARGSLLPRL